MTALRFEDLHIGQAIMIDIWKISSGLWNPSSPEGSLSIKTKAGSSPWLGVVARVEQGTSETIFEVAQKTDEGRIGLRSRYTGKLLTHRGDWAYADGDTYSAFFGQEITVIDGKQVYKLVTQTRLPSTPSMRLILDINSVLTRSSCATNSVSTAGRIGFVKLAICILRMVPNSASTECTFSSFGVIHTKRRNRLNAQKVHKQVMVHDNIMQAYQEAGVLPIRKKLKFGAEEPITVATTLPDASTDTDSESSLTQPNDFRSVASILVAAASDGSANDENKNENENEDHDNDDVVSVSAPRVTQTSHTSASTYMATRHTSAHRRPTNLPHPFFITLANLFDYSTEVEEDSGLAFQWNVAQSWHEDEGLSDDDHS
ncbi:hypothetical protein CPB83DRAFT_909044 [Crepidotus variabilis]|uniref:Uncharacterized protein n=1 Tax=Crepidotus variabilis TaxID=179855 RepID=A0A9P6EAN8_9AGAR|nr:hypothetical protein CPB83DRAFT_909044 [Crepidotus variabilis]